MSEGNTPEAADPFAIINEDAMRGIDPEVCRVVRGLVMGRVIAMGDVWFDENGVVTAEQIRGRYLGLLGITTERPLADIDQAQRVADQVEHQKPVEERSDGLSRTVVTTIERQL
jgi:hypothetical protein